MGHLEPKMACLDNSGSAVRIALQFCTMERAKRDMETILMVFQKNLIWGNLVILTQKWYILITLDLLSVFFLILHNKRVQEVHENFVRYFLRKNLIWSNLIFLGHFLLFEWAWSKFSSQDMISFMITTESL